MSYCPEACFTDSLFKPQSSICDNVPRTYSIKKIIFAACDWELPTGGSSAVETGIIAAITAGKLTSTGAITNPNLSDPTTSAIDIATCYPDMEFITGREFTFNDYSAQDVNDTGTASPFFEIDRVNQIMKNRTKFNLMYIDCDGKLFACADADGEFVKNSILVYKKPNILNNGGTKITVHYFEYKIKFASDPFMTKPIADLSASSDASIKNLIA